MRRDVTKLTIISLLLSFFLLSSETSFSSVNQCKNIFQKKSSNDFKKQSNDLLNKLNDFLVKNAKSSQIVNDVAISLKSDNYRAHLEGKSNFLVISVHGLSTQEISLIREDILSLKGENSFSIPLKNSPEHLFFAYKETTYDFDYRWGPGPNGRDPEGWKVFLFQNNYSAFDGNRGIDNRVKPLYGKTIGIEPIISLSTEEALRLQIYLKNVTKNPDDSLGRFDFQGTYSNLNSPRASLEKNVPPAGFGNNCTSWIMTAPISTDGKSLLSLIGPETKYSNLVATSPGWLLGYILTKSNTNRNPVTILWTSEPLKETVEEIKKNGLKKWNFNTDPENHY